VTRSGRRRVHWVGCCSTHPLILHPNPGIVSLLGSETGKSRENHSSDGDTSNRASSKDGSLISGSEISKSTGSSPRNKFSNNALLDSKVAVSRETIGGLVFLAVVVFPQVGIGIRPVTGVDKLLAEKADSGHIDTSSHFIASSRLAVVRVVSERAGDRGVDTTDSHVASGVSAKGGRANNRGVNTTVGGVGSIQAEVVGASVVIVTGTEGVDASASCGVTRVDGAQSAIIAVHGSDIAVASGRVTRCWEA